MKTDGGKDYTFGHVKSCVVVDDATVEDPILRVVTAEKLSLRIMVNGVRRKI
jgi:hypothetical protein